MAKFIWRSLELAKTPGFCVICSEIIEAHSWLVILITGPLRNDWVRAHKECALNEVEVMGKPVENGSLFTGMVRVKSPSITPSVLPDEIKVNDEDEPVILGRELDPKDRYKAYRYGVFVRGQLFMRFTERRQMEGAAAILQQLHMYGLLVEPVEAARKVFT